MYAIQIYADKNDTKFGILSRSIKKERAVLQLVFPRHLIILSYRVMLGYQYIREYRASTGTGDDRSPYPRNRNRAPWYLFCNLLQYIGFPIY